MRRSVKATNEMDHEVRRKRQVRLGKPDLLKVVEGWLPRLG